jgi:hypothetical protein
LSGVDGCAFWRGQIEGDFRVAHRLHHVQRPVLPAHPPGADRFNAQLGLVGTERLLKLLDNKRA